MHLILRPSDPTPHPITPSPEAAAVPTTEPVAVPADQASHQSTGPFGELLAQISRMHRINGQLRATMPTSFDGLPWSSVLLLKILSVEGPRRSQWLATRLMLDPSTVSRQVESLVQQGLAERRADPGDGRATLVAASDAGLARNASVQAKITDIFAAGLADWDPGDVAELTRLLTRLNDSFQDMACRQA